jgi:FAD:protein FMN transferase
MVETQGRTSYEKTVLQMGTVVHVNLITKASPTDAETAIERALGAFRHVEKVCSRFDDSSELRRLSKKIGEPVVVSDVLFEVLRFALTIAEMTGGVFDPTLGRVLYAHGFHRHYLTGCPVFDEGDEPGKVNFKDVVLDEENRTVLLRKPLTLDLGAVAKGFAVDLAARELNEFEGFVIDAGGDVRVGGLNEQSGLWHIGIRHPLQTNEILCTLQATDVAVCTSGGYERKSPNQPGGHHLIHPQTGKSPNSVLSSTVIAPFGMMADAFSTVSFLLGCEEGVRILEDNGLDGFLVDESLNLHMTRGMKEYLYG